MNAASSATNTPDAAGPGRAAIHQAPADVLAALWSAAAMPPEALSHVTLTGQDPILPSSFAIGTAAQACLGASALAAAAIWAHRTGRWQDVSVDMRHALAEFRSERYLRVNGGPAPELWDRIAGLYPAGDGRWVRLHTNFPHHRDGVLKILKCAYDKDAVRAALSGWKAEDFETVASDAGMVVSAMRSLGEWLQHPQAQALQGLPPVIIEKIGDAPPEPLPAFGPHAEINVDARPLSGVRVLDFTRIIAGPVAGRTLAAHGADVLLVTAAHLPSMPSLVIDTGRGKRSCQLDLRDADDKRTLHKLFHGADVVVQGYRPNGLAELGAGPDAAARARPGIVYVSLSAYGHVGPWSGKRGFDSLVQTATGINTDEAHAAGSAEPRPLPAQVLDHASGYLLAFGAMVALHRRAVEGGSWHVRVSLAQVGQWLRSLGRVPGGTGVPDQHIDEISDLLEVEESGFGELTVVRHAAHLSETPAHWALPSVPLGTHAAEWLPR